MNAQNMKSSKARKTNSRIAEDLYRRLGQLGYKSTMVPITRLQELGKDIDERNRKGQFAPELFDEQLKAFDFNVNMEDAEVRSIIIIAAPQPFIKLGIKSGKRALSVVIPPTYSMLIDKKVERELKAILEQAGHNIYKHQIPLKSLAVRSGLARYGRNNLAYVEGMGSYCRLNAFCTSLPIQNSIWTEPQSLQECENCVACIKKCPTKAIDKDRFLIQAERCLTFHNEREVEFPPGLHPEWHHCLIGCLYCQAHCPVNMKVTGWIEERGTLDENDTAVLLEGGPLAAFSEAGHCFIDEFEFGDQLYQLSRNLKALLDRPANIKLAEKLLPSNRGSVTG